MIKSTVGQLEEFKKSIIWLDILSELDAWLEDVHSALENPSGKLTHMELDRLGGNAEAFHKFKDVLDYMAGSVKAKQEDRELKREWGDESWSPGPDD